MLGHRPSLAGSKASHVDLGFSIADGGTLHFGTLINHAEAVKHMQDVQIV